MFSIYKPINLSYVIFGLMMVDSIAHAVTHDIIMGALCLFFGVFWLMLEDLMLSNTYNIIEE